MESKDLIVGIRTSEITFISYNVSSRKCIDYSQTLSLKRGGMIENSY